MDRYVCDKILTIFVGGKSLREFALLEVYLYFLGLTLTTDLEMS